MHNTTERKHREQQW